MKHVTEEQIYDLAVKIASEADFTEGDVIAMKHIARCDSCYETLCCMMAMQSVSDHLQLTVRERAAERSIRAVLRLAVNAVKPVLDMVEAEINSWTFRAAPMALAAARSGGGRKSGVRKLVDRENSRTFVAYDPVRQLLVLQVDGADCADAPEAVLRTAGGEERSIVFEKREDVFWAEVGGLAEGDYEIELKK